MKNTLDLAKQEFIRIGNDIIAQNPISKSNNPIQQKIHEVEQLQVFLDKFSKAIADQSNEILEEYKLQNKQESSDELREEILKIGRSTILELKDNLDLYQS